MLDVLFFVKLWPFIGDWKGLPHRTSELLNVNAWLFTVKMQFSLVPLAG